MSLVVDLRRFLAANGNLNPKLLGEGIGVNAVNLDVSQGDFRGLRSASSAHTLTGYGSQQISLYRMGRDTPSDTQYWLAFNTDADFARSMLANDPTERTYYTGVGGKPRYTDNTFLGTAPYPTGSVELGVPAPSGGIAAALNTAGPGATETRVYTDTFVRANGDESAPNTTPSSISVTGGSTVNLNSLAAVPSGNHGITLRRIYVSTSGGPFQQCVEQAAGTTSALDSGARGPVLQTGGSTTKPAWLTPPDDLKGITELWSGMHGAFEDKAYRVCVPFSPHAWPVEYRRAVPDKIVGTAKWGQQWLIATTGLPRVVTGTTPGGMGDTPIYFRQACVSKRSVRSVGHGVCWASNSGLCYHGQRGTAIITERILTKAQWRALNPASIIGANWGDWYIGFYSEGAEGAEGGFMINTTQPDGVIWLTQVAAGVFEDSISESLYLLTTGNVIRKWDAGTVQSATFRSKVFRHPSPSCPSAARVVASTYPVTFSMWADGSLKVNAKTVTNDDVFRLPGGYMAEEFQVEVSGTGPLEAVFVGEEVVDLP
jgi:hypothetical protein